MSKDERIIQNQDNKKTIRHEDYIAGIGKGMAILDSFSSNQHRLNISMAAEKTGLTRAAARRHLLTLEYLGYLESDGHYYYLTPKVLKFSGAYLGAAQLPKVSQPLLNLLSVHDKFHRTLILSGFCLLKIAKISLNSSFFPKPIKR
ncbi:IclR family transcriptional regulator PcaU, partial [Acinetobacter baumannii]